jgi:hypothetical protein
MVESGSVLLPFCHDESLFCSPVKELKFTEFCELMGEPVGNTVQEIEQQEDEITEEVPCFDGVPSAFKFGNMARTNRQTQQDEMKLRDELKRNGPILEKLMIFMEDTL